MNITGTDNVDHVVQVLADQEMVILSEIVSHAAQMPRKVTEAKTEVTYSENRAVGDPDGNEKLMQ